MAFEGIVAALDAALAGWQEGDDSQAFFGDLVESGFILDSMAIQMPYPLLLAGRLAAAVTDGDGAEEELRRARQLEEDLEWFIGAISSRPAPDIWRDLLDRLRFMVDDVADSVEKEEKNTRAKDDKGDGGLDDCTEPSAKKNKMNTGIEEDATPEKTVVEKGDKQKEGRPFIDDSIDIKTEGMKTITNNKQVNGGSEDVASQKTVGKEGDKQKEGSAVFDDSFEEEIFTAQKRDIGIQDPLDVTTKEHSNVVVRQISLAILCLIKCLSGGITVLRRQLWGRASRSSEEGDRHPGSTGRHSKGTLRWRVEGK